MMVCFIYIYQGFVTAKFMQIDSFKSSIDGRWENGKSITEISNYKN